MFYNRTDIWNYGTSYDDGRMLYRKLSAMSQRILKDSLVGRVDTIVLSPETFNKVFVDTSSIVNDFLMHREIRLDIREDEPFGLLTLECRKHLMEPVVRIPIRSVGPDSIPIIDIVLKLNNNEDEQVLDYKKTLGGYIRVTGLVLRTFKLLR